MDGWVNVFTRRLKKQATKCDIKAGNGRIEERNAW